MAKIVNGIEISKKIKLGLFNRVLKLQQKGFNVCLVVVKVGNDAASEIYIKQKIKVCNELNIKFKKVQLPLSTSQTELNKTIIELNLNNLVNGILVQLPLPKHLNKHEIANLIKPEKDVDGFNFFNVGSVCAGLPNFVPCTAAAVLEILKFEKINLTSKICVVVGKSNLVGKPLSLMLMNKNATVIVCGSKTINLTKFVKMADIVISAVGVPKLIKFNMIKNQAVVVDVGISRMNDGTICGDVDFEKIKHIAKILTPVPGGVGPVTVAKLMENLVSAAEIQIKKLK